MHVVTLRSMYALLCCLETGRHMCLVQKTDAANMINEMRKPNDRPSERLLVMHTACQYESAYQVHHTTSV